MPWQPAVVGATASRSSGDAGGDGVAEHLLVEQPLGLLAHRLRRAGRRLAGHEVHQVAVRRAGAAAAAASRSITWNGGTFARLATA